MRTTISQNGRIKSVVYLAMQNATKYLLYLFLLKSFRTFPYERIKSKSTYPSFFMLWILVLLRWRREEEEGESFVYPIFFFATPPISQRHSDPRHARELVSNPAITTNCHWQKIIIRLSSSQVRASTLVELQALQSFSSHSGSLELHLAEPIILWHYFLVH